MYICVGEEAVNCVVVIDALADENPVIVCLKVVLMTWAKRHLA